MGNGHLPAKWAWVAYKLQLWPGIKYGIGTMTNDMEEAEELLDDHDYLLVCLVRICELNQKTLKHEKVGKIVALLKN